MAQPGATKGHAGDARFVSTSADDTAFMFRPDVRGHILALREVPRVEHDMLAQRAGRSGVHVFKEHGIRKSVKDFLPRGT